MAPLRVRTDHVGHDNHATLRQSPVSRGLNADLRRSCDSFLHWRWLLAGEQHLDGLTANFSPHEPNSDRILPSNRLRYTTVAASVVMPSAAGGVPGVPSPRWKIMVGQQRHPAERAVAESGDGGDHRNADGGQQHDADVPGYRRPRGCRGQDAHTDDQLTPGLTRPRRTRCLSSRSRAWTASLVAGKYQGAER